MLTMPPRTTAAQTCGCVLLSAPAQVSGDDPQRERDAEQPLKRHQPGEQPIGPPMDVVLILGEQLVGAAR